VSAPAHRAFWPYVLWAAVGVLVGLGVVSLLTIGTFVLALALILAIAGLVLPGSRTSAALAAVPGVGILPLLVALTTWVDPVSAAGPARRLPGATACWTRGRSRSLHCF